MLYLTALPSLFFWALLIVGRGELGRRWVIGLLLIWVGSLVGLICWAGQFAGVLFMCLQALLVIVMAFKVFGLDIPRS